MTEPNEPQAWDASALRAILAARQITQQKLAADLGWSEGTVTAYARGRTAPSVARLEAIATYLGVRVVDLLADAAKTGG